MTPFVALSAGAMNGFTVIARTRLAGFVGLMK